MNRNSTILVAAALVVWLLAGCVTTESNLQSPAPANPPAILSHPNLDSNGTNQAGKTSPLIQYDSKFAATIEKKWHAIVKATDVGQNKKGKVVVQFQLHSDGTVSDIKIVENQAGTTAEVVASQAIKTSSPFDPWPSDIVRMVGKDYREITFTFYYR